MNGTTQPHSWIDTVAEKLNLDSFFKKFNVTTAVVIETVSYFTVGVLLGFLIKNYLKQMLTMLVLFFLTLKGLEYMGIGSMVLNWERIKMLTGMGPSDTLESVIKFYVFWVQTHVRQVISLIVGFLVGIKIL
jgi:hypothetical protein